MLFLFTRFRFQRKLFVFAYGIEGIGIKEQKAHDERNRAPNDKEIGKVANPEIQRKQTAQEILSQVGDTVIDGFCSGIGTGGTLTGVSMRLKEEIKDITVVAVEPYDSPLLSQGKSGAHKIQGIGANFVPSILRLDLIDEIVTVRTEEAYSIARQLALTEGVTCGISGGAALSAAVEYLKKHTGARVVVILPDGGDRYLSTDLFV